MKTIELLRDEGLMSLRLYNILCRNCGRQSVVELTPKDICNLYSDEEILKWRWMGPMGLKELKSLI